MREETVTFTLDNGEIVELDVLEQTMLRGVNYILVAENDNQDADEVDVFILKENVSDSEGGEAVYEPIEDDEELQAVSKIFEELLEDVDIELES